jgi:hypothetical protein
MFVKIFNALPHISISPDWPQERMDEGKLYLCDRSSRTYASKSKKPGFYGFLGVVTKYSRKNPVSEHPRVSLNYLKIDNACRS